MRRWLATSVAAVALVGTVTTGVAVAAKSYNIPTIVKIAGIQWFNRMEVGVKKFAGDTGNNSYEVGPAKADAQLQVQLVEDMIAKKADAITVVPFSPEALEPVLAKAREAGIKVVAHEASRIEADLRVRGGDSLELGQAKVKVIHTPGHSEGSICLFDGRDLFTGDTLFIGNCGRTDLPGGSVRKLYHSLHDTILALPPETLIYPGHDYGDAPFRTLGEERKTNPTLVARSLEEFVGVE